jgi:hypothetical protein
MRAQIVVPLLLALLSRPAVAVDLTACDQQVPFGAVAVLQTDLDCSGSGTCADASPCTVDGDCTIGSCDYESGIVLGNKATLQMNGHTLTNGAVTCTGSCTVTGPGSLAGGQGLIVSGDLRASGNLDVHGGIVGILTIGRATLSDVTVSGIVNNFAIEAGKTLRATNVTANGNEIGIVADAKFVGENITTNDNTRAGILVYGTLRLVGLTATMNGSDPENGRGGVFWVGDRGRPRLTDSTVTGNFFKGSTPLDLLTTTIPRLIRSTCGHSAQYENLGAGPPWGVCADD